MHALSTCGCLISLFLLTGCDSPYGPNPAVGNVKPPRTELRMVDRLPENVLEAHITYVPVYSEIYFSSGKRKLSLTATLSIHNTSPDDSLYLTRVQFFNTKGELLSAHLSRPAVMSPLETVEFVIPYREEKGVTGANFIVEWTATRDQVRPLIQCVMIGVSGAQGISFLTEGVEIDP